MNSMFKCFVHFKVTENHFIFFQKTSDILAVWICNQEMKRLKISVSPELILTLPRKRENLVYGLAVA